MMGTRAVEELLRETDRARLRAETMGPAGWLKCPLRGTNKRFLLNTLRSTGLQQRPGEPNAGHSSHATRRESPGWRSRSRSPPAGRDGGHSHKRHRGNIYGGDTKRRDGGRERSRGRKSGRDERLDGRTPEKDRRTPKKDRRTPEKDRRTSQKDRRTSKTRTSSAN
ncbi:uncharacterized protein LOC144040440 isoform X2 [Vanacampus margaritifer]